jgi:hypothetical protein
MKRNEHGELIQSTVYKADANGSLQQIAQTNTVYNEFGYPIDMRGVGAEVWRKAMQFDNHGNLTEEKYLDSNGVPIVGERGYAIKRQSYTSDKQGLRVEATYFDPGGNKTYCTAGYHRLITEFDVTGLLRRQALAEHDPARYKYYQYVSEPEYDAQGHLRRSLARYEDAQGNLAMNSDLAVVAAEAIYDENGRIIEEWRTARDPKAVFGGPLFHIVAEWNSNGTPSRRLRQVCDATRQPLPLVSGGSFASAEETFDWNGQRQRIFETGFDEKLVGFSTRETKFFGGTLQSVTHRRGDLSIVPNVRVVIVEIVPLKEQPKAAELKVGDQLVSANGKPVTSAYGFELVEFPGGWIEVIRGGQRIRIDGFVAGELGASLEDRATPVP